MKFGEYVISPQDERCINCIYFRRLKHNFKSGVGFEESNCCVVWIKGEDVEGVSNNAWAMEVKPYGMCEMFEGKSKIAADKSAMEFADMPTMDYGA